MNEDQEMLEAVNTNETFGLNGNSEAEEVFEEDIPLVFGKLFA